MSNEFQQRLEQLMASSSVGLLRGIRRGVEKESLRVTPDGHLAQTPHPKALGSALTHPYITTDYSEALLEFITPPVSTPEQVIDWLLDLHAYTYQHMGDEFLWVSSMPCTLTQEKDIPIAYYGTSNLGQMKHIYRHGLAHRYGKAMQIIAGIHFNFSFSDDFWQKYQQILGDKQALTEFKNQQYFGMMRNFMRYSWLIVLLFGASPAVCRSFLKNDPPSDIETFSSNTLYVPQGTSLRMSDLGYQNRKQSSFKVSYNSLQEYVHDLQVAVNALEPDYLQYGDVAHGQDNQLTANILQIEAEYYSPIRAKCTPEANERPTHALHNRGVEYIEVRVIDLDPYEPVGINAFQLRFLESFLLMCLLEPSPSFTEQDMQENKANLRAVVYQGRNYNTKLHFGGTETTVQTKADELWQNIQACAQLLDEHHEHALYQSATTLMHDKFNNPEQLSSSRVLKDMEKHYDCGFFKFTQDNSKQHQEIFRQHTIQPATLKILDELAQKSLAKQQQYESNDKLSLADYVQQYLAKE
jgi:glutamate--cysteine ligase